MMTSPPAARVLHDLLEESYFRQMARGGGRWFERRRDGYVLAGFAGLDSPTMSRLALLDVNAGTLDAVVAEAEAFFRERRLPWCVHVTPFTRPEDAGVILRRKGFYAASELTVMTWEQEDLPRPAAGVDVEEIGPDASGAFTALAVEAFRMPRRYLAPLTDITRAWLENGGRGYLARVGGEIAGTCMITGEAGIRAFYNVATLRRFRRRGVARTLMRRGLEDALADNPDHVTLQVARGSIAELMYQRMGFEARYPWQLFVRG